MRVRLESWGAWVRLDTETALVGLDRDGVRALGLDGGALWRDEGRDEANQDIQRAPIEVHMAVTARCAMGCTGCYTGAHAEGRVPDASELERTLDALRDAGVFTVAFGGGEPTTRDDLQELARAARRRGMIPVLTTSGFGVTREGVDRLRDFAQVNVSYDGAGRTYRDVRGYDGRRGAELAISLLHEAGIAVGINLVLTRSSFEDVSATVARARELGAREVQLLRYKPAGKARTLDYLTRRLTPEQVKAFPALVANLSREHGSEFTPEPPTPFHVRIDCALVPFLSTDTTITVDRLQRFGIFGCEAGRSLAAVTIDSKLAPCSFAPPTDLDVGDLTSVYPRRSVLSPWRTSPASEPCASCAIAPVCRGGCKVVASYLESMHAADPECPRVRAHRAESNIGQ